MPIYIKAVKGILLFDIISLNTLNRIPIYHIHMLPIQNYMVIFYGWMSILVLWMVVVLLPMFGWNLFLWFSS